MSSFKARTLMMRGKPVEIHEVTGLLAMASYTDINSSMRKAAGPSRRGGLKRTASTVAATLPSVEPQEIAAFTDAGWSFVPTSQMVGCDESGEPTKVFVKGGGHLALGTNRLTVKVRHGTSVSSIEEICARHGVRVLNELPFAPGLYQLAIEPCADRDAIDVAGELAEDPIIEFAEPEFIEFIGHR
jgi:hypothetical protein